MPMQISDAVLQTGAARFAVALAALHEIERGGAPDGVVYDVDDTFIVKFVPFKPEALPAMRAKFAFMSYLAAHGIALPEPIPSANGEVIEVVEGADQSWAVTKVPKLPGRHLPPEAWDDTFFRAWGRVMGRMHALAAQYTDGAAIMTWRDEHAVFLGLCKDDAVRTRWAHIGERLAELPETPGAFGLIHNDLHAWNLLVAGDPGTPGALSVLDFDVCGHHWFILDIAIALFHPIWERRRQNPTRRNAFAHRFKAAWLSGYAEEYTLPDEWFAHLPFFARYRQILWFLAMGGDPAAATDPWLRSTLTDLRRNIVEDAPIPGWEA